jgi:hypothetical protein
VSSSMPWRMSIPRFSSCGPMPKAGRASTNAGTDTASLLRHATGCAPPWRSPGRMGRSGHRAGANPLIPKPFFLVLQFLETRSLR